MQARLFLFTVLQFLGLIHQQLRSTNANYIPSINDALMVQPVLYQ